MLNPRSSAPDECPYQDQCDRPESRYLPRMGCAIKVTGLVCKPQEVLIRMDGLPFRYSHSLQGKYYRWMVLLH